MDSRDGEGTPLYGGELALDRGTGWEIGRAALWAWVAEALSGVAVAAIDGTAVRSLCLQVLDTHAPAALVQAQAAGLALERLVAARLIDAYGGQGGVARRRYDVSRLAATARALADGHTA